MSFLKVDGHLKSSGAYSTDTRDEEVKIDEEAAWFATTSRELQSLHHADSIPPMLVEEWKEKVRELAKAYESTHSLTYSEAEGEFRKKTLYGRAYDQNRLGKGISGFEGFYIEGSEVRLPYRTYDLLSAPLVAHDDKVDTVTDFWDAVVVLRKSPIIVTVHDPREKGKLQRAEYWTHDRFREPLVLRAGWTLTREGVDEVIAVSRHSPEIRLVKRTFVAKHTSGDTHRVTQYHYLGWHDHKGAPDHELLEILHQAVDQEIEVRKVPLLPITVHCAAGRGRSPAFAASNHLRLEALQSTSLGLAILNIPLTVYTMRKQRPSLLSEVGHWHTIILSLRRFYLRYIGMSEDVIRKGEAPYESVKR